MAIAAQLCGLTRSPSTGPESAVMISGAAKQIATTSAIGIAAIAR